MLSRSLAMVTSSLGVAAHDVASRLSPVEVPGRRLVLGPTVLVRARGADILRFLGEDINQRADFLEELLGRCTQPELDEIMAALAQAMTQRAAREAAAGTDRAARTAQPEEDQLTSRRRDRRERRTQRLSESGSRQRRQRRESRAV